jgi:hypothetical protein
MYMFLTLAGWQTLPAQELLVQWTGVVRNELLEPLPFAHIVAQRDFRGAIGDPQGLFTIITYPRDTLFVSCVGYKTRKIPVPNVSHEDSKHYIKDIILEEDTIMLGEVEIFPWRTYREFKDAFMALELPEDDMQRAYRNIAILQEQVYSAIASRQASPASNFRDMTANRTNLMMTYVQMYPTYSIANPIAWAQFFQALRNGDFKKKNETAPAKTPSVVDELKKENRD